jgi:hypothetical protein
MKIQFLILSLLLTALPAHAGLDVFAYDNLKIVQSPKLDANGDPVGDKQILFKPVDFPERFAGLEKGKVYRYASVFEFRAGSYSGYTYWRNELAKLAGYKATPFKLAGKVELRYDATVWTLKKGPFWELIDFSDAEGVIGPQSCKRIHADFVQFKDAAARHPDPAFRSSYDTWFKAVTKCANNGALVFG